jgi:hypothetical protein
MGMDYLTVVHSADELLAYMLPIVHGRLWFGQRLQMEYS